MKILILFAILSCITACGKKNTAPEEYFSFDADGVHYDYAQDVKKGFGTSRMALYAAASSASVGYFISGSSFKDATTPGEVSFRLSGNYLPTQDTIIFGGQGNWVSVRAFLNQDDYYGQHPPQTGRIIFTERSKQRLTGTFEFDVERYVISNVGGTEWTGDTLHISNGKFSIIPAK